MAQLGPQQVEPAGGDTQEQDEVGRLTRDGCRDDIHRGEDRTDTHRTAQAELQLVQHDCQPHERRSDEEDDRLRRRDRGCLDPDDVLGISPQLIQRTNARRCRKDRPQRVRDEDPDQADEPHDHATDPGKRRSDSPQDRAGDQHDCGEHDRGRPPTATLDHRVETTEEQRHGHQEREALAPVSSG